MRKQFGYIPSFDGLRCIAISFVLLFHGNYKYFEGGWVGVDLFFVLSGFLITSLLQNEYQMTGDISLKEFYFRRALRLLPPLLIFLAGVNLAWRFANSPKFYPDADELKATVSGLFYSANLVQEHLLGPCTHLWSLSVEEHFYFVWPLVVSLLIFRLPLRARVSFLLLLILIGAALRITALHLGGMAGLGQGLFVVYGYRFTPCRMDAILTGSLLAITWPRLSSLASRSDQTRHLLLPALVLLTGVMLFGGPPGTQFWDFGGFVLLDLLCLVLVALAALNPTCVLLANDLFRWVGRRSYGIYLYHFPVFLGSEQLKKPHNVLSGIAVAAFRVGLSLLIAELSFRFVERPILKLKNRRRIADAPVPLHTVFEQQPDAGRPQ